MSEVLGDVYTPVHAVAARSRLRSTDHEDLVVPRPDLAAAASACVVPTIWYKLPQDLRSTDSLSVALSAGYLSVRTAGGASDRR